MTNFFRAPITIYKSKEDIQKVMGEESLSPEDFSSMDEYLDYINGKEELSEGAPIFHEKNILININQIESIEPTFRLDSSEEDELLGNFQCSFITLLSGEVYRCDWSIEEVEEQLVKQGFAEQKPVRKPRVLKN